MRIKSKTKTEQKQITRKNNKKQTTNSIPRRFSTSDNVIRGECVLGMRQRNVLNLRTQSFQFTDSGKPSLSDILRQLSRIVFLIVRLKDASNNKQTNKQTQTNKKSKQQKQKLIQFKATPSYHRHPNRDARQ
jgi:hypothetical protein